MCTIGQTISPLLVTAAIIQEQGKILITQRPAHKPHPLLWEFPGGKLETGESPQQALRRELQEELAIDVKVGDVFDVIFHRYDWGPVLILAYRCTRTAGEIQHLEVTNHRWVTPAEMYHLPLLPADQPLVVRLNQL